MVGSKRMEQAFCLPSLNCAGSRHGCRGAKLSRLSTDSQPLTPELLLHYSRRTCVETEFSMYAVTARGVAQRSQSKRHSAGNYPARAGASSSERGNPARAKGRGGSEGVGLESNLGNPASGLNHAAARRPPPLLDRTWPTSTTKNAPPWRERLASPLGPETREAKLPDLQGSQKPSYAQSPWIISPRIA